jgi:hypothetical protein
MLVYPLESPKFPLGILALTMKYSALSSFPACYLQFIPWTSLNHIHCMSFSEYSATQSCINFILS